MRFESYRTTIRGLAALVLLGTTTALSHAEEPTHTRQPTQQQAKPATTASSKGQGQANVLDFEGDVSAVAASGVAHGASFRVE